MCDLLDVSMLVINVLVFWFLFSIIDSINAHRDLGKQCGTPVDMCDDVFSPMFMDQKPHNIPKAQKQRSICRLRGSEGISS